MNLFVALKRYIDYRISLSFHPEPRGIIRFLTTLKLVRRELILSDTQRCMQRRKSITSLQMTFNNVNYASF